MVFTIGVSALTSEVKTRIDEAISVSMKSAGRAKLAGPLAYCVHELVDNAIKANIKRMYFAELGLDISDSRDYAAGMIGFRESALCGDSGYLNLQKESGLYVKLVLRMCENRFHISIRNNAIATSSELARIQNRLSPAWRNGNLNDVMDRVFDESEGAGFGLVSLSMLLGKIGLHESRLVICVSDTETIAQLTVPVGKRFAMDDTGIEPVTSTV